MRILLLLIIIEISLCSSPYLSLENTQLYSIIEYELLSTNNDNDIFVLNQPYKISHTNDLLSGNIEFKWIFDRDNYSIDSLDEKINIRFTPSFNHYSKKNNSPNYFGLNLDGVIRISDAFLVNEIELDEKFKYDIDFHGDSSEWLMGYFNSSYAIFKTNVLELFAGRVSRNLGALNDFSLILSNNPYAFDHYGFSLAGDRIKYSFYTTRLNDILGIDMQGKTIPIDTISNSQRFWAIQRLDYKISNQFQIALSEATVYGGPNQQFVASFLNPTHFFYAAQRNQKIQLNGFWQINIFYKPTSGIGVYLDLFADDIIVNNEPGINDRDKNPDRLGILIKVSYVKAKKTLSSLRYVRIWNETYTSFRTFENYTYFDKGIGYHSNSFESIKYNYTFLNYLPTFMSASIEIWRNGDRNLISAFDSEVNVYPVSPVLQGITLNMNISTLWKKIKYEAYTEIIYNPESWNDNVLIKDEEIIDSSESKDTEFELGLKLSYIFKLQ